MMINVAFSKGGEVQNQKTTIARTFDADNSQTLIHLPKEETKISLLGNLFLSEGYTSPPPKRFLMQSAKGLGPALRTGSSRRTQAGPKPLLTEFDIQIYG